MIKKEWLHNSWMLFLLLVFFTLPFIGIFSLIFATERFIVFAATIVASLVVGKFYAFVFGYSIEQKLRLNVALLFVATTLILALFFVSFEFTFMMLFTTLGTSIIYFLIIYLFLHLGALAILNTVYKNKTVNVKMDHKPKRVTRKTVKKSKKVVKKKATKKRK